MTEPKEQAVPVVGVEEVRQWAVQRPLDRHQWFDDKTFASKEEAVRHRDRINADQAARIQGWGGSGYTGMRVNPARVVEVCK